MPILEKAFAKHNQNYERIIGGQGYESFRALTGKPVYRFNMKSNGNVDAAWNFVLPLTKRNFPMTSGCCHGPSKNPQGLVNHHAYSLLGVIKLSNGQRLA